MLAETVDLRRAQGQFQKQLLVLRVGLWIKQDPGLVCAEQC